LSYKGNFHFNLYQKRSFLVKNNFKGKLNNRVFEKRKIWIFKRYAKYPNQQSFRILN